MEARAKLFGHPIHQMLIAFPVGLLATAVIFDVVHLVTDNPQWATLSFWMIGAGLVGGVAAAVFGLIDYPGDPQRHASEASRMAARSGERDRAGALHPELAHSA